MSVERPGEFFIHGIPHLTLYRVHNCSYTYYISYDFKAYRYIKVHMDNIFWLVWYILVS